MRATELRPRHAGRTIGPCLIPAHRLEAGRAAVEAGDWAAARDAFAAALDAEETADALLGLGDAQWWLEDVEASLHHRERAYALLRPTDAVRAAMVGMGLCINYGASLGNLAAARGWLGRVARLVDEAGLEPMAGGWVLLGRAALANDSGDPAAAHAFAVRAHEHGQRFGDADLELCALSQMGGSLVKLGRVAEGTALLDEAMAGALGGEGRPDTVVHASCVTIVACSIAAELKRAAQWIRAAEAFNRRYVSSHLYAVCRTHHGGVLFAMGRWEEAERELRAALETARVAEPALHAQALAKLAELRLAEGRIEEAARLLDGVDEEVAAGALAALRLARGEHDAAAVLLRRRLRALGEDGVEAAALLELLVDAEVARGALETAAEAARQLASLPARRTSDVVGARAERALGTVHAASGEPELAVAHLERALTGFTRLEMPLEAGHARLLLARALAPAETAAAIVEARAALQVFEALGAAPRADAAAALLRSLGVKAARSGPRGAEVLTKREREVLALLGEGLSNREIAARLVVSPKTAENHVSSVLFKLDLTGRAQAAAYAVRHTTPSRGGDR